MEVLQNLIHQTAFANNTLDWRNVVMIFVAFLFLFLAIKKGMNHCFLCQLRLVCYWLIFIRRSWNRADCWNISLNWTNGRSCHLLFSLELVR